MQLTILMPSLNEEKSIAKTIEKIPLDTLQNQGITTEILLVDGGSTDNTVQIAKNLGVKVISSPKGYGRQYRFGFEQANGDIIATGDSDNSYPLHEIPHLVKMLIDEDLDFISTNRFANMEPGSMRLVNNFGNRMLTLTVNTLFSLKLKDSQSGMWVFRKKALQKIVLKSNGMPLSQEIKIEAHKKLRAKEVPSSYQIRIGKPKLRIFRDGWENISHLIKKRLHID